VTLRPADGPSLGKRPAFAELTGPGVLVTTMAGLLALADLGAAGQDQTGEFIAFAELADLCTGLAQVAPDQPGPLPGCLGRHR
jgi:hypothetical protein